MPEYKKLLPFDDNRKVIDQFGWLPISIIKPEKSDKQSWEYIAYLKDGMDEIKRSENAEYLPGLGFSEFHAGLAENIIRYWSLNGSNIVDPFSGRATRAVISSKLSRNYYGYEISPTTMSRVKKHLENHNITDVTLYLDDGIKMNQTKDEFADLVFTCPPYGNIEKYESVPNQLSDIKKYEDFLVKIKECFVNIKRVLKDGAFFVCVVGDWRSSDGYHCFGSDTIQLIKEVGLKHHDTIIMQNDSPFAALQAGKCAASRITSKIHEYVIVARKNGEYDYSWYKEDEETNKFF